MPLPKKPRVPIYSSPAEFIVLAGNVKTETAAAATLPASFGSGDVDDLTDLIDAAVAANETATDALMDYKAKVILRDSAFDAAKMKMRVLRDAVWAHFPNNPEKIADYGFDMFVSPASRGRRFSAPPELDPPPEDPPPSET